MKVFHGGLSLLLSSPAAAFVGVVEVDGVGGDVEEVGLGHALGQEAVGHGRDVDAHDGEGIPEEKNKVIKTVNLKIKDRNNI